MPRSMSWPAGAGAFASFAVFGLFNSVAPGFVARADWGAVDA
jgi:hypothetical protein